MLVRFASAKLSTFCDIHNICKKNFLTKARKTAEKYPDSKKISIFVV